MDSFLQLTAPFAAFILYSSLKASVVIPLVLLAQKVLGRLLSSHGRYLLWLPVVISLLTPFGFKTELPQYGFIPQQFVLPTFNIPIPTDPDPSAGEQVSQPRLIDSPGFTQANVLPPSAHDIATRQPTVINRQNLLVLAWLTGVLVLLGIVLVRSLRFSRLVRKALPANRELQQVLAACCKEAHCNFKVHLLASPAIEAPLVTGCFSPTMLLPEDIELLLTRDQLRHVFLHELMHVKRFDVAGNWLLTLLLCLHWFNPLVWFALTRMRNDRELVCDAATLHHLGPKGGLAYGHTLLQLCQPQHSLFIGTHGIGIVGTKSELRRRISALVQTSFPTRRQSLLTGLLLLVLGGLAFSKPVVETARITASSPAVAESGIASVPAPALAIPLPELQQGTANTSSSSPYSAAAPAPRVEQSKAVPTGSVTSTTGKSSSPATESARVAEKIAATALLAMVDANSPAAPKSAVEINSTQPQETWSGSAAMGELTQSIREAKSAGLQFISEWDTTAGACTDIPDQHRRRIPCQLVANITNSDKLYDFKLQCAALADKYNQLARDYSATAGATLVNREVIAATMLRNYQDLTEFCSADTYNKHYPAFAKLVDSAISNSDLARKKNLTAGMSGYQLLTYPGDGTNTADLYSPRENTGPNPAYYGNAGANAASSGVVGSGTGSSGAVPKAN